MLARSTSCGSVKLQIWHLDFAWDVAGKYGSILSYRVWGWYSTISPFSNSSAAEQGNRYGLLGSATSRAQVWPTFQWSPFFAKRTEVLLCKNNTYKSSLMSTVSMQKRCQEKEHICWCWKRTGMCTLFFQAYYSRRCYVLLGSLLIRSHVLTPFSGFDMYKHWVRGMYRCGSMINMKELRNWSKDRFNTERGLRHIRKISQTMS